MAAEASEARDRLVAAASEILGEQYGEKLATAGLEIVALRKELTRTRDELRHRVVNPWRQELWLRAYLHHIDYKGATAEAAAAAADACLEQADRRFGVG